MLIFLDIDGVMIPAKGWEKPVLMNDGFPAFSKSATSVLQQLIAEEVTVMLTTSHKSNFNIEEWKNIFRNRGINIEHLTCLPTNINNPSRKNEIIDWFNTNKIEDSFIIIDDDKSLNELPAYLKLHLVQTSPLIGLTEEHLDIVKTIVSPSLELV